MGCRSPYEIPAYMMGVMAVRRRRVAVLLMRFLAIILSIQIYPLWRLVAVLLMRFRAFASTLRDKIGAYFELPFSL